MSGRVESGTDWPDWLQRSPDEEERKSESNSRSIRTYPRSVFYGISWEEEPGMSTQVHGKAATGEVGGNLSEVRSYKSKNPSSKRGPKGKRPGSNPKRTKKVKSGDVVAVADPANDEVLFRYSELKDLAETEGASATLQELDCGIGAKRNIEAESGGTAATWRENLTITRGDYKVIAAPEYWNDNLIDFWLTWTTRKADLTDVHIFSTFFYTKLLEEGPEAVSRWTVGGKKAVDIFDKKLLFVPVNRGLHWSLCVVVNPGHIAEHVVLQNNKGEGWQKDKPFPCILMLDSLDMHKKRTIARTIRLWLNSEWARLHPDEEKQPLREPFAKRYMAMYCPEVPKQRNAYDCGVFLCRYTYGLLCLKEECSFSYEEAGVKSGWTSRGEVAHMFRRCFSMGGTFDFDETDIERMRKECKQLVKKLARVYRVTSQN